MIEGRIVPGDQSHSQLGVLRDRMSEAGLRHGDEARVLIENVHISDGSGTVPPGVVLFCQSRVRMLEITQHGDDADIPQRQVEIENIGEVPETGSFRIQGTICSNGRLVFRRTDNIPVKKVAVPESRQSFVRRALDAIGL